MCKNIEGISFQRDKEVWKGGYAHGSGERPDPTYPADLGREVKDEEDWWGDLKEESLGVVKRLLEGAMEEEMLEQLRAGRYRRSLLGRGYPNGYRQRHLITELGLVARQRRGGRPGTGRASSTPPLYPITNGVRRR